MATSLTAARKTPSVPHSSRACKPGETLPLVFFALISTQLKAARGAVMAAEGQAQDTRGLLWNNPELAAERYRRTTREPALGSTTTREWAAGLAQTLEIAGQQGHRREAAQQVLDAARYLALETQRQIRADVERRFVQVLALQARIVNERETLQAIEDTATFAGKRVAAGEDSKLDGNIARVEAGRARNQLAVLSDQLLQARVELAELLQWPAETLPEVTGELEPRLDTPSLPALLASALERSQLKALRSNENAARSKLDLERAARYPDVTIGVRVAHEGPVEFRERVTGLSVSLPLPLFKRNAGNVAQASAELSKARVEHQAGEREVEASVRALWQRQQNLRARVQTLRDTVLPALEENQRLSRKALQEGEISLAQLVLVNRQLLEGRRDLLDALTDWRMTRIALEQAAGWLPDATR